MEQNGSRRSGLEEAGEVMGKFAGRMAGKLGDSAIDVTGAMFNSMSEMFGSWWSSAEARTAVTSFDSREPSCRQHFSATSPSTERSYEATRPLYQLGYVARENPEYRGRSFTEVEPDLRRAWESSAARGDDAWPDVRGYVGFTYDIETDPNSAA